jgi:hypothetical protein
MNRNKLIFPVGLVIVALLLYVFGAMYLSNRHQNGGGSSASDANSSSGSTAHSSGPTGNNSPGNSDSSTQSQGAGSTGNQIANPTGAAQSNFVPETSQQNLAVPAPTQANSVPQQSSGGNSQTPRQNSTQENNQNTTTNNNSTQALPTQSNYFPK